MTTTLTAMATLVAVPFLIGVLLAVGLEFSMGRISCGRCAPLCSARGGLVSSVLHDSVGSRVREDRT
jgi:hypothetical protein